MHGLDKLMTLGKSTLSHYVPELCMMLPNATTTYRENVMQSRSCTAFTIRADD